MIPLISYGNFICFIFSWLAALKLYFSYRKFQDKDIGNFFRFYFYLGIFFLFYAFPGIFVEGISLDDLILTEYSFQFALIFLYLALAYFIIIPLDLYEAIKIRKIIFWSIIVLILAVTVINLINFSPALVSTSPSGEYIFWNSSILPQMRYLTAVATILVGLSGALLFFMKGLKYKEAFLKIRSLLIGGGIILMMAASFINYILVAMNPDSFFNNISSSLFAVFGLGLMLIGIYYKYRGEEPFYYKIRK